jgi:hypothetical protein
MWALKYLLMLVGAGLFGSAGALVAYDIFLSVQLRRLLSRNKTDETGAEVGALARRPLRVVKWKLARQARAAGAPVMLLEKDFVVAPDGGAEARMSEICGARPDTLYPEVHLVTPLLDSVATNDTREQMYSALAAESAKQKGDALRVQATHAA